MTAYDRVSTSIDRINDIIMGNVSDKEFREIMAEEAAILQAVAETEVTPWPNLD